MYHVFSQSNLIIPIVIGIVKGLNSEKKLYHQDKDKLPKEVVDDVQSKVDAVKKALENGDINSIKNAKQELETHMQRIGETMAKAQQTAGTQAEPQQPEQPQTEEPIEEAEVEIINDKKKEG